MSLDDWPGRERAASLRQWRTLVALAAHVEDVEEFDGLIAVGSFAAGDPDELSDIDAVIVAARGGFGEAWAARHRLDVDALLSWDRLSGQGIGCHTWLTRDLVKVECVIVDPAGGSKSLADPCVVLVGEPSLVDRFPRVDAAELAARRRELMAGQELPSNAGELSYGELVDWKISELKSAVRRGLRETRS